MLFFFSFLVPVFAESFVDGESFFDDESLSFVDGESFEGGESFIDDESLSFVDGESFTDGESFVDESEDSIGVYDIVVERNSEDVHSSTRESVKEDIYDDIYVNNYGKYLKFVTEKGVNAQENFVRYFSDWQWSGQSEDFFSYSANRAEREKYQAEQEAQLRRSYDAAIKKFGIGTAIVATTWIVSFVVPGGPIVHEAVIIIAKATTAKAVNYAVSGAVWSASIAYLQGKRGEDLLCETVNGAADGYLVGAITGLVSGSAKAYKLAKTATKISDGLMKSLEQGDDIAKAGRLDIDSKEFNRLRLELEGGKISSERFWREVGKNGWSRDLCEELSKEDVNFGKYLRSLIGNPPSGMKDPHAHHILPKTGHGAIQQALVNEGQKILRLYGIDPILGSENLCWAPNRVVGQHSKEAIKEIVEGLKILQESEATKKEIIDFLKVMGQKAAMRR